jgi:hypothetical protein
MKPLYYVKRERLTFPTANALRVLTTRGCRRFRQRGLSDRATAAILHPMHSRQASLRAACPVEGQGLIPVRVPGVVVSPLVWYRVREAWGAPAFFRPEKISTGPDLSDLFR